ncbi:MAG: hypothetical protein A3A80_03440 [Candidatus Terrybacteria bacterium RIFCSPLOWO2_01_FULL_44_24]|uniref:Uncharacterized protein n=1 Tax=Candidatus Terrybacteria bacterium RIFCSPHIGHO2_01_FULL_43_35 TaxID=1802361 RepID=A0A1G2PDG8_9BACT|nr:MAG: hypothetical protein A2828_00355 [Candidatus Terrybacteria bacterium RIFCSPHIGHO2_01_FULL_43_35]OHA51560.1 MAG: hypothetical protein A3A80_03440 [Candidatus Terrybacteria bacterium RIFCSPLOWO2_01_FULL_44_24]
MKIKGGVVSKIKMRHHVVPSSRGGPNEEWNLYFFHKGIEIHIERHKAYHFLFENHLPSEAITDVQNKYSNKDGSLNKRRVSGNNLKAWVTVFGENADPKEAIDFIEREFLPIEQKWEPKGKEVRKNRGKRR